MPETKSSEWRPEPCNTRMGDIVLIDGKKFLKIKCRRCTKSNNVDSYHYLPLDV